MIAAEVVHAGTTFWILIGLTLVVAVADWVAVGLDHRGAEHILKPLTMVVLIGAVLTIDEPASNAAAWWVVAALLCSLAGDVFLMLDGHFVEGLGAFLLGHIAYVIALWQLGVDQAWFLLGLLIVLVLVAVLGSRIVRGARAHDARLAIPVGAYIGVISLMVASAIGTTIPVAIAGALLFYGSDACIGWSRFIGDFRGARLWIMTTYHLGQVGLVLSLV